MDNAAGEGDTSPVSHDASPTRCETSMKKCMFLCNRFSAHRNAQTMNKTRRMQTSAAIRSRIVKYLKLKIKVHFLEFIGNI